MAPSVPLRWKFEQAQTLLEFALQQSMSVVDKANLEREEKEKILEQGADRSPLVKATQSRVRFRTQ